MSKTLTTNSMGMTNSPSPICVLISDVHFSLKTLDRASAALEAAVTSANELNRPLVICGDLHDTKANMRAECVQEILRVLGLLKNALYILVGNHDLVNEKGAEHALTFLEPTGAILITQTSGPMVDEYFGITCVPYYGDLIQLRKVLLATNPSHTLIMHQGLNSAEAGEYFVDKTALNPEEVAGRKIYSGHYHRRQLIHLPEGGTWQFLGNPYTLSFGEVRDGLKGYHILLEDHSVAFQPLTNLPRHQKIVWDISKSPTPPQIDVEKKDFIHIQIHGFLEDLHPVTRSYVEKNLLKFESDFRLELCPYESDQLPAQTQVKSDGQSLDQVIDAQTGLTDNKKARVKNLWRNLCE